MSDCQPVRTIRGTVIHGDKRGRQIGYPTANIAVDPFSHIEFGVYAGYLNAMPAAISVGVRPTFGEGLRPLLEAYVLDFDGDLYEQEVTVELTQRLRGELQYDTVEALIEQIRLDVRAVAEMSASSRT